MNSRSQLHPLPVKISRSQLMKNSYAGRILPQTQQEVMKIWIFFWKVRKKWSQIQGSTGIPVSIPVSTGTGVWPGSRSWSNFMTWMPGFVLKIMWQKHSKFTFPMFLNFNNHKLWCIMIEINIYFIITYIKCVLIVIIYNLLVVIVLCSASALMAVKIC